MTRRMFLAGAALPLLGAEAEFSQPLDELRRKYRIPGMTGAIVRSGEIYWRAAYDYADVVRRTVAMPDTPFPIGFLTAAFSSTLALKLIEQGKLDLDEPAKQFIPMASVHYHTFKEGALKIRHILTHTSDDIPPGETFRFNPKRYAALTYILTQLCGQSFDELVASTFFESAPMPDSAPRRDHPAERYQRILTRVARPYRIDDRGRMLVGEYPDPVCNASTGIISTAVDLARFDIALDEHRYVREETLRLAREPQRSLTEKTLPTSLGWFASTIGGRRVNWLFDDSRGAFSALYIKVPDRRTSLILLGNTDGLTRPFPGMAEGDLESNDFARWFLDLAG